MYIGERRTRYRARKRWKINAHSDSIGARLNSNGGSSHFRYYHTYYVVV